MDDINKTGMKDKCNFHIFICLIYVHGNLSQI